MILIKEAISKKEIKTFVKFPFSLYKDNKYCIPPLINDEIDGFDKTKNPVFKHAQAQFFLAYKDNKIVGRVVAIINWTEVNEQKIKKMRFGWFDMIDDIEVSKALINKVIEIGKEHNLEFVEGPVGFSNMDKVGVLIKGFEELGTMITWYNYPYYKDHLEQLGFVKANEWIESYTYMSKIDPDNFMRLSKIVPKRYGVKSLNFTKTKQILPYVDEMFDLFNKSHTKLASFVPISDEQKEYFKNKYIKIIHPEYIKFVLDKNDKLIAFAITMPSFSKSLQKANGHLFPFGIFHILKEKMNGDEALFYLIGVHPDYINKGVTALLFKECYLTFQKHGLKKMILTPQLEDNFAIQKLFKNFHLIADKRRRTYRLKI